jgi:aminomethyltransferase
MSDLLHSVLHDRHVALGAKMADFGGWEMPIEYPAPLGGVLREHAAVREHVGLFDVSHLGKVLVTGPGAANFVNECLTNDLRRISAGQAQYTLCCQPDGGVVDDLIAYLVSEDEVFLVPNAANSADVAHRLKAAAPAGIHVEDRHQQFAVLAVQGPEATKVMHEIGLVYDLPYMSYVDDTFDGAVVRICRTGYTGELGYELIPPVDVATQLWDVVAAHVVDHGGVVAGLGARDTLRTEMGYPLHGHELTTALTPAQGGAGWAVGWDKPAFWGRDALLAEKAAGATRRLRGITLKDRGIPRVGMDVLDASGNTIGTTTSGTFSPSLRHGIALALLDAGAVAEGDEVFVDIRGKQCAGVVTRPPFVPSHVR